MDKCHLFLILSMVSTTHSYRLQCPDFPQRTLRAFGYCTSTLRLRYTCLFDTNKFSFSEECDRNPDFVTRGEKYVITGNLRNVDCSAERYQPFRLWSNVSGECLYQKTLCKEEGQVIFNNWSLIGDRTCRCDYTKGYKFIKRPKQSCSCNPSEEDCSCYISECPGSSALSPDYECDGKPQTDSKCPPIEIESGGSSQRQNIKRYTDKQEQSRIILIAVSTMCVLVLIYTVIVSVLWEKIPQIDWKQDFTESSTRVVQPTTEDTSQLRFHDSALEKTKLQRRDIVKSKDAKIAELQQLLEQRNKEIEIKDIEIQKKEDEIEERKYDIRTFETERRKFHNQIQELKGNIRVLCRVRPLLDHEKRGNNCKIDHISFPGPNKIQVVKTRNADLNEKNEIQQFSFDKVFTHNATQDQVFEEISQLVQSALDGYNVCIFAYGQTGSGKTFTMEGKSVNGNTDDVNRGMIPRSVLQIFGTIRKLEIEGWTYTVDASCLEIYGEKINDLLCNKKGDLKPEIKDDKNETHVTNITIKRVATEREVYELLQKASHNRTVAATKSNQSSSRGHSVFTLKITAENCITDETCKSTLYLVDLAGSERTKISGMKGQQQKEAIVNKSLTVLGIVIRAIKNKETYVPYRNSKLTYLLKNSMGGNSKTLMLVNISPHKDCVEETVRSLKFATEVNQCLKGVAQKNQ